AEVGLYTALGLELAKEVHAFEPIPYNYEILKNRFGNYKNVYLNQLALADYIGTANFCLGPTTIVEDVKNLYPDKSKEITVQTITLDEYLKKYNKPTFIKMDVEGAEHLIIKGGYNFLKENNPILIVEILGDEFLENSMKTVNILKELGFRAYKINFDGDLEFFDYEKFKHSQGVCNYVFKK
ncbi:MAG: FkbM family methyltransferase, partial [Candidatus Pacearchaeota archaeon]